MSLDLQQSVAQLQQLFDASKKDEVTKLVTQLKLAQSGLYFAPPDANPQDLLAARTIIEIGAFNALRQSNLASYNQYNAALQPFYVNLANTLPPSANRPIIIGLQLLTMLSEGKYSQFHMALEGLDVSELGDVFVRWPVDLERWMMEGAYNKIYRARDRVPREEYAVLLERLMGTIREQIALTIETSYPSLPLQNAAQLLFFRSGETAQLVEFAKERGWDLEPSTQTFTFPKSPIPDIALAAVAAHDSSRITMDLAGGKGIKRGGPMQSMVKPALELAQQLEAIV
ncbi:26S proteasome non-ATPase regulatory subunit 8 [Trichosporon asahii var. asahii CBS 8904]|uniref:26S proteasome non-ATPase regulatory subunit 8 n=1 Tax=Trichosporon asahii var. asahii (strain CBS 8904) TaxID=1220162 RepID=K1W156_TRIAC|nr:26S proteasome non-ATPase regulatory subunit 8 [Trichosporon asahii var. asahii CBS 8904]